MIEVIIQSDLEIIKSKPRLGTQTYFTLPSISKKQIDAAYKEALMLLKRKKDVMEQRELYEELQSRLQEVHGNLSITFLDSVMDIFDDIVK